MAEVSIVLNQGTGGPSVAGYAASNGWIHQEVVMQTQAGSTDPVSVSASNPMPVQNVVSLPAGTNTIGNVGVSSALPAGANVIGGVTQSGNFLVQGNVASGGADSGNGVKVSGIYNTSTPSFTNGQRADFQADVNGNLCVNIKAGAAAGGTSSNFSSAFPAAGTAVGASNGTNMQPLLVDGSGNLKVNIVAGGMAAQTDNSAFTTGTGLTLPIAALYNDGATATSGNAGMPRMSSARQLLTAPQAVVNGGAAAYTVVGAATTNAAVVKSSAGNLYTLHGFNIGTTPVFVKFYNASTTPVPGTTTCVWQAIIPGNTAGAGVVIPVPVGLSFSTGIGIAITANPALTDATAIAANVAGVSLAYA